MFLELNLFFWYEDKNKCVCLSSLLHHTNRCWLCLCAVAIFICVYVCVCMHTSVCTCTWELVTLSQHLWESVGAERAQAEKATKATVSPSAWTCRLCGLVSPRSQPTPPTPPPSFSSSSTFFPLLQTPPYSHWSITLNECQSFRPAVGSKQSLL